MHHCPHRRSVAAACTALAALMGLADTAAAQSDPTEFGTVYNIGALPVGSIYDVPGGRQWNLGR